MPEKAQELTVTNAGQPIAVQLAPAQTTEIAQGATPRFPANVTVELTPAR